MRPLILVTSSASSTAHDWSASHGQCSTRVEGIAFDVHGRAVSYREFDLVSIQHVEPRKFRIGDFRGLLEAMSCEEHGRPVGGFQSQTYLE